MKKKSNPQPRPACRPAREGGFFNLRVSIGLLTVVAGLLFVLFATANPSKGGGRGFAVANRTGRPRSEEHTSELQSPCNLLCRLLLEKKIYNRSLPSALIPYAP